MNSVGVDMDFVTPVKRFQSRGQQPRKFIGTKTKRLRKNRVEPAHRVRLGHQHDHRFIVLGQHCCWRDVITFLFGINLRV